jgi:pimeloyl-ACP methyl ester carboxylesterase
VLRWLTWVVCGVLALTATSLLYNAATAARAGHPPGLTFVRAGDLLTRYREWGRSGSPVVLVPGAFETADTFAALGAVLGSTHRVYALDLTGTGYSQAKPPYTVGHLTAQVLAFVAAMHLTGRDAPVLVGHSSGAAVVGLAALEGGRRVAGVMFLDGDAAPLPGGSGLRRLVVNPFRTTVFRLGLRSDWVVHALYDRECGPACPRLTSAGVETWRRPLQQPGSEQALWATLRTGIPSLTPAQLQALHALATPKAVVWGADDPQYPAGAAGQVAVRIGAPAPTVVPGRHLTMISSPRQVAEAVAALCARAGQ